MSFETIVIIVIVAILGFSAYKSSGKGSGRGSSGGSSSSGSSGGDTPIV